MNLQGTQSFWEKVKKKKSRDRANHQQHEKVKISEVSVFNGTSFAEVEKHKKKLCYFKSET